MISGRLTTHWGRLTQEQLGIVDWTHYGEKEKEEEEGKKGKDLGIVAGGR